MSAQSTDKLRKWSRKWVGQIGAGGVSDASTLTIPLSSTTNLPTDTGVTLVIDRVDSAGALTPALEETIVGVVSGSNMVTCVRGVEGTAQAHSAGAVVELLVTASEHNDMIDAFLVGHSQSGAHASSIATLTGSEVLTNKTLTSPVLNGTLTGTGVTALLGTIYPIGSVYISVVSTSPATLFGFGTWSAFAAGRTLVGIDAGQTEFDTVEETGGAKTHTLITAEMPAHTHPVYAGATGAASENNITWQANNAGSGRADQAQTTGGGGAHNNLQPYIVTYMWKRTA